MLHFKNAYMMKKVKISQFGFKSDNKSSNHSNNINTIESADVCDMLCDRNGNKVPRPRN